MRDTPLCPPTVGSQPLVLLTLSWGPDLPAADGFSVVTAVAVLCALGEVGCVFIGGGGTGEETAEPRLLVGDG
jgi:hypothetical protein